MMKTIWAMAIAAVMLATLGGGDAVSIVNR